MKSTQNKEWLFHLKNFTDYQWTDMSIPLHSKQC
jgi:hypothetical protein